MITAAGHSLDVRSNPPARTKRESALRTLPILDKDGNTLAFDIFIDDSWHGSRRTLAQCKSYFGFVTGQHL
jgi:hypothetical protein